MDTTGYIQAIGILGLIIGLILLAGSVLKKWSAGGLGSLTRGRRGPRRLEVVEVQAIDPRRRLVLVRRDDKEHLILIGGPNDLMMESDITRPTFSLNDAAPLTATDHHDDNRLPDRGRDRSAGLQDPVEPRFDAPSSASAAASAAASAGREPRV